MAAPFKPRYTVIHGQYRIHRADNPRQGPQPDGDTVRFEPNNLQLWQKLKRSITDFLTRVWRDGALFGAKAQDAFYVRIDEALRRAVFRLGSRNRCNWLCLRRGGWLAIGPATWWPLHRNWLGWWGR